jgi:hypothetical protein
MECLNTVTTLTKAQRAVADSVLTELELGLTFLDVAETTNDPAHALQSVKHALTALRAANKFLGVLQPGIFHIDEFETIQQRREQLVQRLHAIWGAKALGGSRAAT